MSPGALCKSLVELDQTLFGKSCSDQSPISNSESKANKLSAMTDQLINCWLLTEHLATVSRSNIQMYVCLVTGIEKPQIDPTGLTLHCLVSLKVMSLIGSTAYYSQGGVEARLSGGSSHCCRMVRAAK